MKRFTTIAVVAAIALAALTTAPADAQMEPYRGSAEFERLKALIGVWEGEMPMAEEGEPADKKPMQKMRVEYRLTAGGSVIQEITNAGSPMEMISMYHDRDGRLSMTHYCMLGNQPRMDLVDSKPGQIQLAFSEHNELDPDQGMHMHSLGLSIVDRDNMVQHWTMKNNGEGMAHDMHFSRVQ